MLGRGLRLHCKKSDCLVIDIVDQYQLTSIVSAPSLLGFDNLRLVKQGIKATHLAEEAKRIISSPSLNLKEFLLNDPSEDIESKTIELENGSFDGNYIINNLRYQIFLFAHVINIDIFLPKKIYRWSI